LYKNTYYFSTTQLHLSARYRTLIYVTANHAATNHFKKVSITMMAVQEETD